MGAVQETISRSSYELCPTCGQPLPETKVTKPLYCPLCKREIGHYNKLRWDGNTAIDEYGNKVILCGLLYHEESPHLKDEMVVKPDGSNALVHLEECMNFCRKDPSYCPHDIWHQKNRIK